MTAKVTINGKSYPFDSEHYPLAEAIELEEGIGMPFAEWEQQMLRGSAKAIAGYVWLVLKRNGKDVPLADILSGEYAVDTREISIGPGDGAPADPTGPGSPQDETSGSPPSPSSTARGSSRSSTRSTSTTSTGSSAT